MLPAKKCVAFLFALQSLFHSFVSLGQQPAVGTVDLQAACDKGSINACKSLGRQEFKQGNFESAKKAWTISCDKGDVSSCRGVAAIEKKEGRTAEADKFLKKACDKGDTSACTAMTNSPSSNTASSESYNGNAFSSAIAGKVRFQLSLSALEGVMSSQVDKVKGEEGEFKSSSTLFEAFPGHLDFAFYLSRFSIRFITGSAPDLLSNAIADIETQGGTLLRSNNSLRIGMTFGDAVEASAFLKFSYASHRSGATDVRSVSSYEPGVFGAYHYVRGSSTYSPYGALGYLMGSAQNKVTTEVGSESISTLSSASLSGFHLNFGLEYAYSLAQALQYVAGIDFSLTSQTVKSKRPSVADPVQSQESTLSDSRSDITLLLAGLRLIL